MVQYNDLYQGHEYLSKSKEIFAYSIRYTPQKLTCTIILDYHAGIAANASVHFPEDLRLRSCSCAHARTHALECDSRERPVHGKSSITGKIQNVVTCS